MESVENECGRSLDSDVKLLDLVLSSEMEKMISA